MVGLLFRIAWRNLWRHRRRTFITAAAMGSGVAMCMAMVALADGMYTGMFDALVGMQMGHVQVHHPDYPRKKSLYDILPDGEGVLVTLNALPEAVGVAPRLFGYGLVAGEAEATGMQLVGVDPPAEAKVSLIAKSILGGRYLADGAQKEILLGHKAAEDLEVTLGDELVVITQAADGSMGNELYTVVGLLKTGSASLDRRGSFIHIDDMRELLVLPGGVHEIALVGESSDQVQALKAAMEEALQGRPLLIRAWEEVSPMMAQMMAMQDGSVVVLLGVVFAVAGLGILNTMLMSVFERTTELGLMNALGMTPTKVMGLILWETTLLAALSTVVGVAFGLLLDAYFVLYGWDLSAYTEGFSALGVAFEPILRAEFRADRVVVTVAFLFVVSFLAALWPALRAARLEPVAAMREDS